MATKGASAKGIMLPDAMWEAVDEDALVNQDSRSRWIQKRIADYFRRQSEVGKSNNHASKSDAVEFE